MQRIFTFCLFIIVSLTWGTTWLAMRVSVETIPPLFATGMRFAFASPFLLFIAFLMKKPLLFPRGQRFFQFNICIFYFCIPFSLMIFGEQFVSSGLASIVFSFMPVAVMIASFVILEIKLRKMQLLGLIIATVSLMSIIINESVDGMKSTRGDPEAIMEGIVALIIAVIIHSIIYAKCKQRSCNVSVITFNALPCLLASVILLIAGSVFEAPQLASFSVPSLYAALYLGAFAGVFGILSYFALQERSGTFRASLVYLIFPIIAIILESMLFYKTISELTMLLMLPLAIGVLITITYDKKNINKAYIEHP